MRAAVLEGNVLVVKEVPDPIAGPGEVLVTVERCGICGTDLHLSDRYARDGLIPGHEIAGIVRNCGSGVSNVTVGQRVAVKPSIPCTTCASCQREEPESCPNQWSTHIGLAKAGGFAQLLVAPADNCLVVPDHVSASQAALAEPYAVALHGLSLARTPPGTSAVVIGAGPIGLLITIALVARGVLVDVVEPSSERAKTALKLGATDVYTSVDELEDGDLSNRALIVECSGAPGMADNAIRLARIGGSVVLMATSSDPISIDAGKWTRKQVAVRPSIGYSMADFRAGLHAVTVGVVPDQILVSSVRPLEEAQASIEVLRRGEEIKIQLAPNGV